jgi:hypothetical protein
MNVPISRGLLLLDRFALPPPREAVEMNVPISRGLLLLSRSGSPGGTSSRSVEMNVPISRGLLLYVPHRIVRQGSKFVLQLK